jgi:sugar lactone lactonase YvrE
MLSAAIAADPAKVQIDDSQKVFPESLTSTADGALYVGSITVGTIYKAASGATKAEIWQKPQADGPTSVLGVLADEKAGLLWACYSDLALFGGKPGKPAILRAFDLASGAVKASYAFPGGGFCNDIATTSDGTAYATDTLGGRVLRLKVGATDLEEWFKDAKLAGGVDGLSFGSDGALYVNHVGKNQLFRIDLGSDGAAKGMTELQLSQPIKGPDGMRFGDDGKLYLAENGNGQADAITISADKADVKMIKNGLEAPTAVTKVGNTIWVLEAKIDKLGGEQDPGPFFMVPVTVGQ